MTPLNSELSFEVPDWIYLLFFSAVNQNLRSLENYQSWISELLFGTWSYGPGLQSVFDRVLHTDRYNMEIISWKERAKDVYSQVAMHQKNELVSAANEWFFFIHCNEWPKVVPALLMVWCFYFKHSHIFSHLNSKTGSERLWKYIVRPIRDTNDNTSQCKSQYVWNKINYELLEHIRNCTRHK